MGVDAVQAEAVAVRRKPYKKRADMRVCSFYMAVFVKIVAIHIQTKIYVALSFKLRWRRVKGTAPLSTDVRPSLLSKNRFRGLGTPVFRRSLRSSLHPLE